MQFPVSKLAAVLGLVLATAAPALTAQQEAYLGAPIHYETERSEDAVARLRQRIAAGEVAFEWDEQRGWLPALLTAFEVPVSSQLLVFSQTSLQADLIGPKRPRALYFNDEVAMGWIPGAPLIELTVMDPVQGPTFYAVEQAKRPDPIQRADGSCLSCHAGSRTRDLPGNLVRSVHPDADGRPILRSGTDDVTHATPFEKRWGGWYVTGTHGDMRHRGNAVVRPDDSAGEFVDPEAGANVVALDGFFDTAAYLSPHSDLVALMVLEHQAQMQTVLARASYEGRLAKQYSLEMNAMSGRPADFVSASVERRYASAARRVVQQLLFFEGVELTAPVAGTSAFAKEFEARGVRDSKGRSLRDFDLQTRLFRHPCSYLIHSSAFDRLPPEVLERVYAQLGAILAAADDPVDYPRLTAPVRRELIEMLREVKPGMPAACFD